MISKFLRATFLIGAVVAFVSCGSDDEGPAEAAQVKFRAQVGGASFRTDTASGVLSNSGKTLSITATNDVGETIIIRVGNFTEGSPVVAAGTYQIDETDLASISYAPGGETLMPVLDAGGVVTLSSFNVDEKTVFGSFTGTVTGADAGEITITAGSLFNISYTEQ